MLVLFILSFLISTIHAYSKFLITCTTPPDQINYVSSPNTRGTLDILWSCFFTIIACTWTIQHLNVPEQRNTRDSGWKQDLKWAIKSQWRNIKWMLAAMLAPEYILGKAFADLYAAIRSKKDMEEFAHVDRVEWGLTHAFFANMGGFVLCEKGIERSDDKGTALERQERGAGDSNQKEHKQGEVKRDDIELASRTSDSLEASKAIKDPLISRTETVQLKYNTPFHLLASEILALRGSEDLPKLPNITTAYLNDKGKDDLFIKLLTVFQVFWFVLQVIVRAVKGLNISQLEIAVTAFAFCAIITYILVLPKPKGAQIPITLMEFETAIPIERLDYLHVRELQGYIRGLFDPGEGIVDSVDIVGAAIPNDALQPSQAIIYLHIGVTIGGVIFGTIHIAAWNFTFPTLIEQALWRAASIMSTGLLPVMYVVLLANEFYVRVPHRFIKIWDIVFGELYLAARLFLLVEAFRTLFYLPADAYVTTWTASVPHFS
ncbi:hypothetical protein FGG08_007446 [Glutinoglossum americanum]|uniref:Uncharacterized protein n=1 Tax=Glutinoglossum americanum TaxID=1670608 RepID=A0A9P8L0W7_9PEZI|nr:hypothetical protein FGG08_007446 [Glutinoglossum americanum]